MVGIGVLGCGYWGPKLIRSLDSTPGFRLVAACDLDEARRAFIKQRHPGLEVLSDPEELFQRDEIQAVWVATPVRTHFPLARRALERGKHVLVEKPLATRLAEARSLTALAGSNGLTLHSGHTFLYSPAVVLLREMMAEGAHGRTCYLTCERINPGPPRTDVSVLWDLAVHDVAIVLDLIGRAPVSVSALGRGFLRDDMAEAVFLTLDFGDRVMAQIHVSWMSSHKTRVLKVFGTHGTLIYDDMADPAVRLAGAPIDNRLHPADAGAVELAYGPGEVREFRPVGPEPLRAECAAFLAAIQFGTPAPNHARHAVPVVEVLEAADLSISTDGRPVRLGPSAGVVDRISRGAAAGHAAGRLQ